MSDATLKAGAPSDRLVIKKIRAQKTQKSHPRKTVTDPWRARTVLPPAATWLRYVTSARYNAPSDWPPGDRRTKTDQSRRRSRGGRGHMTARARRTPPVVHRRRSVCVRESQATPAASAPLSRHGNRRGAPRVRTILRRDGSRHRHRVQLYVFSFVFWRSRVARIDRRQERRLRIDSLQWRPGAFYITMNHAVTPLWARLGCACTFFRHSG